MGKHNLDRLFEEKLANNEVVPSQQAWDTLSEGLSKKRKINVSGWLSIAASAAILITSAYLLVQTDSDKPSENYISSNVTIEIAPDVPNFEPQLPVFIRQNNLVVDVLMSVSANTQSIEQEKNVADTPTIQTAENEKPVSQNQKEDSYLGPILDSDLIKTNPVLVAEEVDEQDLEHPEFENQSAVLASAAEINQPVTIIYKQGEVEEKSNISKALTFMDEVRKGEKKLINMNKIKTNLFAKNKEQVSNSE